MKPLWCVVWPPCTAALPSDERASQPCPQCGTKNQRSPPDAARPLLKGQSRKLPETCWKAQQNCLNHSLTLQTNAMKELLVEKQASATIFGKKVLLWEGAASSEDDQWPFFFGDLAHMSSGKKRQCLDKGQGAFATAYGVGAEAQKFRFSTDAQAKSDEASASTSFVQQVDNHQKKIYD
ncbi:hypothetical protein RvY_18829 [Ramazzottius varieornatus]|uniref:Uncharacterized protein n=1 Tax=Ramazzottius varieornatus TaxID=947166 RepID=A0A1D1WBT8_RAMVA|nr:hypothetical protein RvY_18829 [Ramazzottius varieornatus]